MPLSSDNYPPAPEIPEEPGNGKGGGGWGGAGVGWNLEKEYAEIYDGWIGGFQIGEDGDLNGLGGVGIHPIDGIELSSGSVMHWGDDVFEVGELSDTRKGLLPSSNNTKHLGASDCRWRTAWFYNIYSDGGFTTGDLLFKNDWVITEEDKKLIFINPDGKKVLILDIDGSLKPSKSQKKYDNVEKFKKEVEELKVVKLTKEQKDEQVKKRSCVLRHRLSAKLARNQSK